MRSKDVKELLMVVLAPSLWTNLLNCERNCQGLARPIIEYKMIFMSDEIYTQYYFYVSGR